MFILGWAHQSHPAKHVLGSAVGGGWPLSQAQHWVANKTSAQPGSPSAARQTPEGGRPWPGPVRLARPAAATLTNTLCVSPSDWIGGQVQVIVIFTVFIRNKCGVAVVLGESVILER
jgi:hypothetical protein